MLKFSLLTLVGIFMSVCVIAQDKYWVGTSGANWSISANWSSTSGGAGGAGAPTSVQNAIFDADATLTLDINTTVNSLYIKQTSGGVGITVTFNSTSTRTFTINAGASPTPAFKIEASCTLNYAAHSSSTSNVLTLAGSAKGEVFGTLNVAGPTSTVTPRVSFSTANNLTIKNGGKIVLGANSNNPLSSGNQSYVLEAGGIMEVNRDGFTVPDGNFDAASITRFKGFVNATSITNWSGFPNVQLGSIEFDCSSLVNNFNILTPPGTSGSPYILKGSLKIINTNGKELRFCSNTAGFLQINGNLEIGTGTKFSLTGGSAAGTVYLKGNLLGNGEITEGGSATTCDLVFNGTSTQTASFNTITNDSRFTINNPAGLTVTTNWTLPNSTNARILLTDGNVDMGTNLLDIQRPSALALSGGTLNSHIIGRLRRATNSSSTYLFPVSKSATEVASIKLNPIGATATAYEVEFFRPNAYNRLAQADPLVKNAGDYYWNITRVSGTENADLTVRYDLMQTGNINSEADLRILHWNSINSNWDNLGGSGAGSEIFVNGVSDFSPFTLGTVGATPLPVHLFSFSGFRAASVNKLSWTTASENNNAGFEVQRSIDGRTYEPIGFVHSLAANGNSSAQLNYSFTDATAGGPKHYYRLKQMDVDGRGKMSSIVLIRSEKSLGLSIAGAYPNPANGTLNIWIESPQKTNASVQIVDAGGRVAASQNNMVQEGASNIPIDLTRLSAGVYVVRIRCDGECGSASIRIIKQ